MTIVTKTESQRFVFPDMTYQDFPHDIDDINEHVIVDISLDLSDKMYSAGSIVLKDSAAIDAENAAQVQKLISEFINQIDGILDTKAKEYGYDNIKTAVTYADEPSVTKFQNEGKAFRRWRSEVYDFAYSKVPSITPTTTFEELMVGSPVFVDPV